MLNMYEQVAEVFYKLDFVLLGLLEKNKIAQYYLLVGDSGKYTHCVTRSPCLPQKGESVTEIKIVPDQSPSPRPVICIPSSGALNDVKQKERHTH